MSDFLNSVVESDGRGLFVLLPAAGREGPGCASLAILSCSDGDLTKISYCSARDDSQVQQVDLFVHKILAEPDHVSKWGDAARTLPSTPRLTFIASPIRVLDHPDNIEYDNANETHD